MKTEKMACAALMLFVAVSQLCFWSCSVKEDRRMCPARLVLYSDGHVAEGCGNDFRCSLTSGNDGSRWLDSFGMKAFAIKGDLVYEVPRDESVQLDIYGGIRQMRKSGDILLITPGNSCDSIYSGHAVAYVPGEEGEASTPLNKDFATLTMYLSGMGNSQFSFRINGNVDGFLIPGGVPHAGKFECIPDLAGDGVLVCRIPRQLDDSLLLELLNADDGTTATAVALGKTIAEIGYDWLEPDLKDIVIGVDVVRTTFSISVEGWETTETIKIDL